MAPVRGLDGAILLGGASSRMGRDKARLPIAGVASLERVAEALSEVCETLYLIGGDPPEGARGHRIPDPEGPRCALRGVVAALDAARLPDVLVVATDLPLITPAFLSALAEAPPAEVVLPRDAAGMHPVCARYRREPALAVARRRLAAGGDLSLRGVLAELELAFLEGAALAAADPDGTALLNVNDPDDLERAEALLAGGGQGLPDPGGC